MNIIKLWLFRRWLRNKVNARTRRTLACWIAAGNIKARYVEWINNYRGEIYRKCKEVTEEMQIVFPELRIAKGMVTILDNGKDYQHQWLVDTEGNIIDPTKRQWVAIMEYNEIKSGDDEPVGKCYECGQWVYRGFYNSIYCGSDCYATRKGDYYDKTNL